MTLTELLETAKVAEREFKAKGINTDKVLIVIDINDLSAFRHIKCGSIRASEEQGIIVLHDKVPDEIENLANEQMVKFDA